MYAMLYTDHTESITEQISKRYHCDVQKHVGKVYPETHAEYYFKLLSNQQQLAAIGYQYGSPSLWDFQGVLGASLFLLIAIINVYECIMEAKKRVD